MNYREEREIDLIDLGRVILQKWRLIIVFMIIGLVMGSVAGYYTSAKVVTTDTAEVVVDEDAVAADVDSLKAKLSDREIVEVEMAVNSYYYYQKLYSNKEKYIKNSIRMQLDADKVPTMTASYIISDYYEVSYPVISEVNNINNIVALYSKKLFDSSVIDEVSIALGKKIADNYVKELYSVGLEANSILNVTVTARSEEECKKVLTVLMKELEDEIPAATEKYEHSITYLDTYYSVNANNNILSEQQTHVDALKNYQNLMLTVGNSLTTDQKALYTKLLNGGDMEDSYSEVEENNEIVEDNKPQDTVVVRSFDIKYAVLGLFGGAFIIIALICVQYILSQTIKTKDEFTDLFKVNILGVNKNNTDNALGMITASSVIGAQKASAKSLYITSSLQEDVIGTMPQKLVEAMKQNDSELTIKYDKSILTDPSSLRSLADSDGVIFIEKLKTSRYEDIAKEIEIAKNYGTQILGFVVVE